MREEQSSFANAPPVARLDWRRTQHLVRLLRRADLVTEICQPVDSSCNGDILPLLRSSPPAAACFDRTEQREQIRLQRALQRQFARAAKLTLGVPGPAGPRVTQWVGERLIWWPQGIPTGLPAGVVSSRLGRPVDMRRSWFAALRVACRSIAPGSEYLLSVDQTAAARFVAPAARMYGLPLLRFHLPTKRETVLQWLTCCLEHWQATAVDKVGGHEWHAFLAPPFCFDPMAADALQDRLLVAYAARLFVCRVRSHGLVHRLLTRRLDPGAETRPQTSIAVHADLSPPQLVSEFVEAGAEPINISVHPRSIRTMVKSDWIISSVRNRPTIFAPEEFPDSDRYLLHCTRHQIEHWPDQDEDAYLEDLILDLNSANHSALATLQRILAQRRLRATNRTIRGGYSVVSFTQVRLSELSSMRVYRTHRTRWDFQPIGLGIARQWLERHGARPVVYGESALWDSLPLESRPFFQVCGRPANGAIDWSLEREWRYPGDVILDRLSSREAFVFVPDSRTAQQLVSISPWPIVVVASSEVRRPSNQLPSTE